jgi:adenosylmethionine-8-amino-7-oxononanoate aminotransferase
VLHAVAALRPHLRPGRPARVRERARHKLERGKLLRGFLPGRLLEAGLIARPDDRGDSVLQIAPPLICDAAVLDEIVDRLHDVLADAGRFMDVVGEPTAVA